MNLSDLQKNAEDFANRSSLSENDAFEFRILWGSLKGEYDLLAKQGAETERTLAAVIDDRDEWHSQADLLRILESFDRLRETVATRETEP